MIPPLPPLPLYIKLPALATQKWLWVSISKSELVLNRSFAGHHIYKLAPSYVFFISPPLPIMRIKYVILFHSIISPPEGQSHSLKQQGLHWSLRKSKTIKPQSIPLQQLCPKFQRKQWFLLQQQQSPENQLAAKNKIPKPTMPSLPPYQFPACEHISVGKYLLQKGKRWMGRVIDQVVSARRPK